MKRIFVLILFIILLSSCSDPKPSYEEIDLTTSNALDYMSISVDVDAHTDLLDNGTNLYLDYDVKATARGDYGLAMFKLKIKVTTTTCQSESCVATAKDYQYIEVYFSSSHYIGRGSKIDVRHGCYRVESVEFEITEISGAAYYEVD